MRDDRRPGVSTTRRGLLAALTVASTAGCTGLLSSKPSDSGTEHPLRGETVKQVSEIVDIPKGDHEAYSMQFTEQTILIYSIVADRKVDVIVFAESEYDTYRRAAAETLNYVSELSQLDTRVAGIGSAVAPDSPVLVIDNTNWAEAPPVSNVTVEVDLEAFVRN